MIEVDWKTIWGWLATSRKSAPCMCSSRIVFPVLIDAISASIVRDVSARPSPTASQPLNRSKVPRMIEMPRWVTEKASWVCIVSMP